MYIYYLISEFILGDSNCATNGGPSSNVSCIFPFKFNGVTYNECALDSDGYWCSTKVDSSGVHIGGQGNWGICSQGCPGVIGKLIENPFLLHFSLTILLC